MYSITFKSDSKTALEYLRETAYEKIPEMDEMTVDQLDAMIKEPKERTHNEEHVCDVGDKWCQEGANPARHPDHDSHVGGCNCELKKESN